MGACWLGFKVLMLLVGLVFVVFWVSYGGFGLVGLVWVFGWVLLRFDILVDLGFGW